MTNIQFTGLEVAREEFNKWNGKAAIYIDCEDKELFTHVGSLPEYEDDSIFILIMKDESHSPNDKYSIRQLNNLVEAKYTAFKSGLYNEMELENINYFAECL